MQLLQKFQEWAVPLALALTAALSLVIFFLFVIYVFSIYSHERERAYVKRNQARWQKLLNGLFEGSLKPSEIKLSRKELKHVRDLLLDSFFSKQLECLWDKERQRDAFSELKLNPSCSDKARSLYRDLGFFREDMRELGSKRWWVRVKAMERIEDLGINDGEEKLLKLLTDKRSEVRFSSLRTLAVISSKRFYSKLGGIFDASSTWSYLYLVNILYFSGVPLDVLATLASSDNPYKRKAAAILLGRIKSKDSVTLLLKLASDDFEEVRREAVLSLARTGSAAAMPLFWRKLKDQSPEVRTAVAKGIGELGQLAFLTKLADDEDFDVRFQAFASLAGSGLAGREAIKNYRGRYPELASEFLHGGVHV